MLSFHYSCGFDNFSFKFCQILPLHVKFMIIFMSLNTVPLNLCSEFFFPINIDCALNSTFFWCYCCDSSFPRADSLPLSYQYTAGLLKIQTDSVCLLRGEFNGGSDGKECACNATDWFNPWVRKIPWIREWLPTLVFLPGEFHGQRSLVGYNP